MASKAAPITTDPKTRVAPAAKAGARAVTAVNWREMTADVAAWDRLANEAAEPNPFFESWFLLPSLEAYDPGGELRILRFDHDGKLAGLMPLVRSSSYYGKPLPHLGNWLHANSFLGAPLVAAGREVPFWHALLAWADRNAGTALFLHLSEMSLGGPLHAGLGAVLSSQGRKAWIVQREERAILSSRLCADEYRRKVFSASKRKDLRRRMNRLSELGEVQFEWQQDDSGIARWCDQFLALEASGWKGERGSALTQDDAKRSLFCKGLAGAARRGRLLRLAMHLNGEPVAMLSTFLSPPGAFGFKTAFDEQYARHAPGILLENEFMSALDERRFEWCDSCAAADHPVMNDIWGERRTIGKVSVAIGGALRRQIFSQIQRFEKGKLAVGEQA